MKARFFALAALVLGLASCQNDFDAANVGVGGEVDFQLSVNAPELATRAGENGADNQQAFDSAFGAIDYLQGGAAQDALRVDWTDVDLRYVLEVYDVANGAVVGTAPVKDRQVIIVDEYEPVTFELRLVPKRNYRFVVFADFVAQGADDTASFDVQNELGLHHDLGNTLQEITVKRTAENGINNEVTDAYFAFKDVEITNSASNDIVLQRPYGKLRVIATDLHEINLNSNPDAVKVEYTALQPQTLNAVTGEIGAIENTVTTFVSEYNEGVCKEFDEKNGKLGLQNHFYNAGYDALKGHEYKNANGDVRHTHMTLFTDYILATEQQHSVHFTMTVYDKYDAATQDGRAIKTTTFNTDIPVQRNYLTTVIGNVLTTATEIEVRIDDNFAGEIPTDNDMVFVSTAAALQEALDNFEAGQVILFENNIEGQVTVDQNGKDYIVDGNGFEYDGTIYIDGNSNHTGTDTVTIKNINFNTDSDKINFIEQNSTESAVRYPHNVTIEGCSFNATGVDVIGIKIRQGYNIVVKDCVADGTTRATGSGMHSLAQLYGCTGVTLNGVDVNAERGISLGTSLNCLIKDSKFVANTYGVRADATVATTLAFENVDITAELPVIARKTTGDYTISFTGNNTLTAPGYQVVLTKGDDEEAFVAPTSNYTLTGAESFRVFPSDTLYAYNLSELQYLIDNAPVGNTTICLAHDIEGNVTIKQKEGVNIVLNGCQKKYDGSITVNGDGRSKGAETLKFININFETEHATDTKESEWQFISAPSKLNNKYNYSHNVTIENCTFKNTVDGVRRVGSASFTGTYNLTMKNCTATNMHSILQAQSCDNTVLVDGVTVIDGKNGIAVGNTAYPTIKNATINAIEYGVRGDGNATRGNLVIENSTINAKVPVIIRKVTTNGYNVALDNATTLTKSGEYHVVFTKGDDEAAYEAPTANYTLTSTKGYTMFPGRTVHEDTGLIWNGATQANKRVFYLYNAEDLAKAATYFSGQSNSSEGREATINIESDIDLAGTTWTPWSVMFITVNANGHTISNLSNNFFGYAGAVTVNDLTLENVTSAGNQAGTFAASTEGTKFYNCFLKGENKVTYVDADKNENGVGAISGVTIECDLNVEITEGTTVEIDMNTIENTEKTTFVNYLDGYKHTKYDVNKGTIVNNGTVTVKASKEIVADGKGTNYNGEVVDSNLTDALIFEGSELTGDATINIKRSYQTVILDGVTAAVNDDLIVSETDNTIILHNCNITLPEGKKLVIYDTEHKTGQLFVLNVRVNGKLLKNNEDAAPYVENVTWYQTLTDIEE